MSGTGHQILFLPPLNRGYAWSRFASVLGISLCRAVPRIFLCKPLCTIPSVHCFKWKSSPFDWSLPVCLFEETVWYCGRRMKCISTTVLRILRCSGNSGEKAYPSEGLRRLLADTLVRGHHWYWVRYYTRVIGDVSGHRWESSLNVWHIWQISRVDHPFPLSFL